MFAYNIVLIGFMGSGKSSVAKYLNRILGMEVLEMDAEIAMQQGMSISGIFEKFGEEYFRKLETKLLQSANEGDVYIISCGGGVALREKNVEEIKKKGKIIFLNAEPQTIYERVKHDTGRPLLNGRNHVEGIAKLMQQRQEKYLAAADLIVSTDNRTVEDIGEEIVRRLKEMGER